MAFQTKLNVASIAAAFVAAFLGGLLFAAPQLAAAAWWASSSAACRDLSPQNKLSRFSSYITQEQDDVSSSISVVCALPDTSTLPKETLVDVSVYGRDSSTLGWVSAKVCVGFYNSLGGACGAADGSGMLTVGPSYTGNFAMHPPVAILSTYPSDYGYLEVTIPAVYPPGAGGASSFAGFEGTQ
jgi:hypothetical protein